MSHMKWLSKKFYSFHLLRGAIQGLHMIGFILFYISLSANACNPKYEACAVIKDRAMELKSAEKQCEEIRRYGSCVDVGLRDCREGNFDNTYALRIESIYCATGYRCLQDLRQCYENVTDVALLRITNTARDQRSSLCWTYVIPIMSCQDKVLEECRDQVGLLEEISLQQQNLLDVCEETIGCIGRVLQCQSEVNRPAARSALSSTGDPSTDCFTRSYVDYCLAYRKAVDCVQSNMSSCSGSVDVSLEGTLKTLQETTTAVCDEQTTCIQKAATCLCHISKSTSLDQTSMYRSICHTYPLYESCIQRNVESRCYESTSVSDDITTMLDTYVAPYDLLCTDYGGLCVGAVQCIFELNSTSSVSGFLDLDRLCRSADTLFECLELASDHCGPVRPLPSVVDFISLRDHLLDDSCPVILPYLPVMRECPNYNRCLWRFGLETSPSMGTLRHMEMLYSKVNDSRFWCRYLRHTYRCFADTAVACSLDPSLSQSVAQLTVLTLTRVCEGTSINVEIRQGGEQGGSYDAGHLGKGKQTDGGCRGSLKINTRMAMVSLLFAYTLNCLLDHCSSFHTVTWG